MHIFDLRKSVRGVAQVLLCASVSTACYGGGACSSQKNACKEEDAFVMQLPKEVAREAVLENALMNALMGPYVSSQKKEALSLSEEAAMMQPNIFNPSAEIEDDGVFRLKEQDRLKGFNVYDLSHCEKLTSAGYKALATGCPGLRALTVTSNENFSNLDLKIFASHCNQLNQLVAVSTKITTNGINALLERCKVFNLDLALSQIKDDFFKDGQSYPWLEFLRISGCKHITTAGLKCIGDRFPQLKELDLFEIPVTLDAIQAIVKKLPKLQILTFKVDDPNISFHEMSEIARSIDKVCKDFECLNLSGMDDRKLSSAEFRIEMQLMHAMGIAKASPFVDAKTGEFRDRIKLLFPAFGQFKANMSAGFPFGFPIFTVSGG